MRRQDGSIAHSLFHRSEKRQSTLAACSTITDEASTSSGNSITDVVDAKTDSTKKKSRKGSRKEASVEVKEKDVPPKKKKTYFTHRKAAAKKTEELDTSQENKKVSTSKSKKAVDSTKAKKASDDGSGNDRKPLTPLYPPTAKSVVVVESVTKAKVIQKYLGDMYEVLPSYGHVRDLAGRSRSVRPDDDFSMVWEVPATAWTHLKSIKVALKGAENLILASDPDREGEAIAWHIKEMLEQQGALGSDVTVARVVFHEITEDAIKTALVSPRYIDMNLVNAYLARRSLDYLIGFGISPLLWRKLPGCQSAGRVQSAALALVCDRETEIEQFKPQEYWTIQTDFKTPYADYSNGTCVPSRIKHLNSKKLDQLSICSQEEAQAIEKRIHTSQFEVIGVKRSKIHKNPPMPYITSSLQQDAANKLQFTAGHTMKVISFRCTLHTILCCICMSGGRLISDGAAEDIRSLVNERYGQEYTSENIRKYSKKVKNAQEAHEAIRPTSIRRLPCNDLPVIQVDIGTPKGDMIFHSSASRLDFKGYQAVYEDTEASPSDDSEGDAAHEDRFDVLSKLKVKDSVSPVDVHLAQHFTKPPPRYSEGALIKKLEDLGIGRPSTYASIMKVLQDDRNYVTIKSRVLHPEFRGRMVSAFLLHHFSEVADYSFTANMETELDNVSAGSTEWKGLMKDYWERFSKYCADVGQLDVRKVFLKQGPYGYYVQIKDVDSVTIEDAIDILQYPKILGKHPDDDHPVLMTHSKVGFNIRHRRTLAPVPKNTDPKKMTLKEALKLLSGKNVKRFGRPKGKAANKELIELFFFFPNPTATPSATVETPASFLRVALGPISKRANKLRDVHGHGFPRRCAAPPKGTGGMMDGWTTEESVRLRYSGAGLLHRKKKCLLISSRRVALAGAMHPQRVNAAMAMDKTTTSKVHPQMEVCFSCFTSCFLKNTSCYCSDVSHVSPEILLADTGCAEDDGLLIFLH
ncbi:hypothetical protein PR202_gb17203 [Eleusine coracana subsp. coracana]|uniref:DNA topoisomerase n=1 Tax=Eleusine coracana subsp. coracana TaxID=191504 RepID=A0AAV5F2X4_ELECO|nr:hypothetical protein PR202_gb17203 [Eleusine coracana subsp. coracana]